MIEILLASHIYIHSPVILQDYRDTYSECIVTEEKQPRFSNDKFNNKEKKTTKVVCY